MQQEKCDNFADFTYSWAIVNNKEDQVAMWEELDVFKDLSNRSRIVSGSMREMHVLNK